jgi:predicted lipoprotein with Yx(FWY)xxD motif
MIDSPRQHTARPQRRRRAAILKMGVAAATLAFAVSFAAIALAASSVRIDSASNAALGESVLVSSQGRTLYELSPETAKHLLCKSAECLKFWPPLTVSSTKTKLRAAAGVHGRLGILHRGNGMLQVTLNGLPLYRFAEDRSSGEVKGQNFHGFGGIWHVLGVSGSPSSRTPAAAGTPGAPEPPPMSPPAPAPSPPSTPGYSY